MNLGLSPVQIPHIVNNSPKFGMAKFTPEGMRLAQASSDVYEPLREPTEFQEPMFFKDKKLLRKAPFARFLEKKIPARRTAEADKIREVRDVIYDCGTSDSAFANAKFIRQLLTTQKYIDRLPEESQTPIREAIAEAFDKNWNNPELTKKETMALLEMSKGPIEDHQYTTLVGVIEKSDIK